MYLVFDKETRELIEWSEECERNMPEDSDIWYESEKIIVINKPNWTPGTVELVNGRLRPENDKYLNKDNQVRTMTPKKRKKRESRLLKKKLNEEINKEVERKIKKISKLPVAYIIEMNRLGRLYRAGKSDEIDTGFAFIVDYIDDFESLYKQIMLRLFTLYGLRMRVNRLEHRDRDIDPDELQTELVEIKDWLDT